MAKSIISLVLSDAIIEKVDYECIRSGKSRSQHIDDLLARHYGIDLPSIRFSEIVGMLNERMSMLHTVSMLQGASDNAVEFRTVLSYRYQPKILFQIQFSMSEQGLTAAIKISSRTTSAALIDLLKDFFVRLDAFEIASENGFRQRNVNQNFQQQLYKQLPRALPIVVTQSGGIAILPDLSDQRSIPLTAFDGSKFIRLYRFNVLEVSSEEVSEALLRACKWMHSAMNLYFKQESSGLKFEKFLDTLFHDF